MGQLAGQRFTGSACLPACLPHHMPLPACPPHPYTCPPPSTRTQVRVCILMQLYTGLDNSTCLERMPHGVPVFTQPDRKLGLLDVAQGLRDHFEGTPHDGKWSWCFGGAAAMHRKHASGNSVAGSCPFIPEWSLVPSSPATPCFTSPPTLHYPPLPFLQPIQTRIRKSPGAPSLCFEPPSATSPAPGKACPTASASFST